MRIPGPHCFPWLVPQQQITIPHATEIDCLRHLWLFLCKPDWCPKISSAISVWHTILPTWAELFFLLYLNLLASFVFPYLMLPFLLQRPALFDFNISFIWKRLASLTAAVSIFSALLLYVNLHSSTSWLCIWFLSRIAVSSCGAGWLLDLVLFAVARSDGAGGDPSLVHRSLWPW